MYADQRHIQSFSTFFFNDTATTEIYTLSLHDALPIYRIAHVGRRQQVGQQLQPGELHRVLHARQLQQVGAAPGGQPVDRKSTRLNSSHANISYAVFCLKKKKTSPRQLPQSHSSIMKNA